MGGQTLLGREVGSGGLKHPPGLCLQRLPSVIWVLGVEGELEMESSERRKRSGQWGRARRSGEWGGGAEAGEQMGRGA